MAVIYGVLRGKLDRWKREDPPPGASKSPHLQVRVIDAQGKPWRIPVNVRSGDPAKSLVIFHRAEPLLSHPILEHLVALPSGLTDLNRKPRSASNALDYSRAPLFDWPTGIALPPTGPGENDDLQDVVSRHLDDLKASGGELFAFGSHFHDSAPKPGIDAEFGTKDGMHDIHMNQGNAPHEHDEDNGVFNDGGLILRFPDHVTGLFFRFKTQFLPTDAKIAQVDIRPENLGRRCKLDLGLVGDVGATIGALLPKLKAKTDRKHLDDSLAHYKKARAGEPK